jgi:hypothetical protein
MILNDTNGMRLNASPVLWDSCLDNVPQDYALNLGIRVLIGIVRRYTTSNVFIQ